ncbi:DUF1659 domain-containing protein [Alkalibacter saccharofermentans]|uniref:DUF1659 domain-containing protein n=1 Tax=Alkalibacter saccharofermentans DSM 14828 TaxID=1120975 RepID=A0A1M4WNQ9_9FIRM|nr:DUF1659 domain-containing protein [Alkalibacter saccharofermentans]SHE82876.1 Protein of unknown function [Alkalibacter saccharofermentans DSM 14828]
MAVESTVLSSRMVLKLNFGTNENGNPIVRNKTYSNMNNEAADQEVYDVAEALADLQTNPLEGVHKIQETVLVSL